MISKPQNSFSKTIHGIQVYKEDLDILTSKLEGLGYQIKTQDKDFVYDDIADVANNGGLFPKQLDICASIGYTKYVNLYFNPGRVYILTEGDVLEYGLGLEFAGYFKSKISWHYWVINTWIFWLLANINGFVLSNLSFDKPIRILLWVTLFILVVCWVLSISSFRWYQTIILSKRHEHGFWVANKDKIILAIISAMIGALIAAVIKSFF